MVRGAGCGVRGAGCLRAASGEEVDVRTYAAHRGLVRVRARARAGVRVRVRVRIVGEAPSLELV